MSPRPMLHDGGRRRAVSGIASIPAILALALVLRAAWCILIPAQPVSDFLAYHEGAAGIAAGRGYLNAAGQPTAYLPIGYPAFLAGLYAIFGTSIAVAKIANIVLSTITIWICYRLFARMLGSSSAAAAPDGRIGDRALLLFALLPSQILYTSLLSDSVLFQFLLLLGISIQIGASRWRLPLAGVVYGLAALTRPYALAVPLIVAAAHVDPAPWRSCLRHSALLFATAAVVIVPWTFRNQRVFHRFIPISTNGGINLLIGNGNGATGAFTEAPLEPIRAAGLAEPDADRLAARLAVAEIRSNPARFIRLIPAKLFWMFADDAQALRWNLKGLPGRATAARYATVEVLGMGIVQACYAVVLVAALAWIAIVLARRRRPPAIALLGVWLTAYFAILAIIFFGNPRYHFPLTPFFCLYAVSAPTLLYSRGQVNAIS